MSATLELLKGSKKEALDNELKTAETTTDTTEAASAATSEVAPLDVDALTAKGLNEHVKKNKIVIEHWSEMDVPTKRLALKAHLAGEAFAYTPSAGKTVATSNVEVLKNDLLMSTAHKLENLDKDTARKMVRELIDSADFSEFQLGGVLSKIASEKWFEPYETFAAYCDGEYDGLNYRKARYLVNIYDRLVEAQIPWEKVAKVGWTKLKELVKVMTADNVDEWVQKALANNVPTLIGMIENSQANGDPGSQEPAPKLKSLTFKLTEDKKKTVEAAIAKVKTTAENPDLSDSQAVELMALEYINNASGTATSGKTLEQQMKALGMHATLEALEKAFPDLELSVGVPDENAG